MSRKDKIRLLVISIGLAIGIICIFATNVYYHYIGLASLAVSVLTFHKIIKDVKNEIDKYLF